MVISRITSFRNTTFLCSILRSLSNGPPISNSKMTAELISKKGDHGTSTTDAGAILNKDHDIFNAMGSTEELLSYLGLVKEFAQDAEHEYVDKLKRIQTILIELNNSISKCNNEKPASFVGAHLTNELEEWIQEYSTQLPPVGQFIMPGGGKASASLHIARSVCRKTERSVVPLVRQNILDKETQVYLNRLSDFLLTVARMAAKYDQRTESVYVPKPDSKEK